MSTSPLCETQGGGLVVVIDARSREQVFQRAENRVIILVVVNDARSRGQIFQRSENRVIIHARFKRAVFSVWERTEKNSRYVGLCDKLQIFCSFFGVLP